LFIEGVEYATSRDSVILLIVSILVTVVVVLLLCRIPLAIPGIVAGARRFGIGGIAAPRLSGNFRLLAALVLAILPVVAVNWLLAEITGISFDSPRYTDHKVLANLVQFGQQLAIFAYFAVSYGIFATAWYLQADALQSSEVSTPFQRKLSSADGTESPTPPDPPPPERA
jgi:hypothetical protein